MSQCGRYHLVESKLKRYNDLGLRDRCAKPGDPNEKRKGIKKAFKACKVGSKKSHYWALCPNKNSTSIDICLSFALIEHDLLRPLLELIIHKNKKKCKFYCLLDTGS